MGVRDAWHGGRSNAVTRQPAQGALTRLVGWERGTRAPQPCSRWALEMPEKAHLFAGAFRLTPLNRLRGPGSA